MNLLSLKIGTLPRTAVKNILGKKHYFGAFRLSLQNKIVDEKKYMQHALQRRSPPAESDPGRCRMEMPLRVLSRIE